jgi:signal transduction histidine kinase
MKSTQQQIADAGIVYETYWDSYLAGDVDTFASTLDDHFKMIGTTENEVCDDKAGGIDFCKSQLAEVVGKVEKRNRQVDSVPVDGMVLINEFFDIYILVDADWDYYSKARVSTLLRETPEGWKVVQQHGSLPDNRVQDNETLAFDKISKENLELRDAVKRRTVELEQKSRELEIEAALEIVRSRSLAMQHTSELQEVIHTVHKQLLNLNIAINGGSFIAINSDIDKEIRCWGSGGTADTSREIYIPLFEKPFYTNLINGVKNGAGFFTEAYTRKEKNEFFTFLFQHEPWSELDSGEKEETLSSPGGYTRSCCVSRHTSMFIINHFGKKFSDAENDILKRFSKVFEQAYTRFLDLQKAEAQTKEAQIETALEKVRSRSLAMHKSNELNEVVKVLFEKMTELQVPSTAVAIQTFTDDSKDMQVFVCGDVGTGIVINQYILPYFDHPIIHDYLETHKKKLDFYVGNYSKKEKDSFYDVVLKRHELKDLPAEVKTMIRKSDVYEITMVPAEKSLLAVNDFHGNPLSESQVSILKRFAKVFDQTYTRFLDLQKAEAQAREAKIETALEKVRSRTMGMQSSDELPEVANLLFLEVQALGIPAWSCGYNVLAEDKRSAAAWMSSEGILQEPFKLRLHGEASFDEMRDFILSDNTMLIQELDGRALEEHYEHMKSFPDLSPTFENLEALGLSLPTYQINHLCKFTNGFMLFITYEPVPDAHDIFKRFTKAFDQTYTRFLDLQKSEQRAREAEVELSLERVRAQVTAMQESSDLFDVVVSMRSEFLKLGHKADYFWHMHWLEDSYEMSMTSEDGNRIGMVISIPKFVHDAIPGLANWEKSDEPIYVLPLDADGAWDYIENMNEHGRYKHADPNAPTKEDIQQIGGLTFIIARTTHGEIGYSLSGEVPEPPKDALDTLTRFAGVFDLAYKRFEDLKATERQHRKAQIDLALEKVRSRSIDMRKSAELQDVILMVNEQFKKLKVGITGGAFIVINEKLKEGFYCWGAGGAGDYLQEVLIPPLDRPISTTIAEHIKKGTHFFTEEYSNAEKKEFFQHLFKFPPFSEAPPERKKELLDLPNGYTRSCVISKQTSIFIINHHGRVFTEDENIILRQMGRVFEQAYTRFLDLKKASEQAQQIIEERDRLEITLNELHSTQAQLIQQEKLASLGQLTAGIAHEIKNPLNFVNNFSELSVELVEEARHEIRDLIRDTDSPLPKGDKGGCSSAKKQGVSDDNQDTDFLLEILDDIETNLKKIHEHGSRADSIVKSMLQHSRGGSGKMEPTPINALVKEFVNLAFHGMRAGKQPINVDIDLDLDESIGTVPVISENISRVLLNLCNNAFDAMREKAKVKRETADGYEPRLAVRTLRKGDSVTIEIEDNGPGIPDEIKDKILQPFFTTKKGTAGTGLGLSITNDIIKAHGGAVRSLY